ncbi:MAG: glycine cleavage system protein GcvH [Calditrichaeota bacterium]|nr:MAG: glycine cleavage system protein GcvH [Calditrichota bacterium]
MNVPEKMKYTSEHEWVAVEGSIATIGITEYAQGELGDLIYIKLPDVDDQITQKESFGTVEAVKAASDLYAPVSGVVTEVNQVLADQPELVNKDPFGAGWMIKVQMSNAAELNSLLSPDDYKALIG